MKRVEIIILTILAIAVSIVFLRTSSWIAFFASVFQVSAACAFFILNATKGIELIKQQKWALFLFQSLLPFIFVYGISIILYTQYWVSLSNTPFQLEYTLSLFPHKEAILLTILYPLGIFYGYLRQNKRAVKITIGTLSIILIIGFSVYFISSRGDTREIEGVKFISGTFKSVDQIAALPQFSDKTVYVDLWFSNCTPCIQQFKNHLPQLKEALKSTNVEYLYLARETSHFNSEQRWINTIDKYQLKGWHYYFSKSDEQMILDGIRSHINADFKGYPHYLISKNGKIISYNAPAPSSIQEVLEALQME